MAATDPQRSPEPGQRLRLAANVLLVAVGLGVAPLARKTALEAGAEPLPVSLTTVAVAAVFAAAFLLRSHGARRLVAQLERHWFHVALVGVLGSAAVTILAVLAMTGTSATNRGLFQAMYPVATAVAARLLLGERPGALVYAIIALMTLGLLAMNAEAGALRLGLPFWLLAMTLPLIGLSDVYARRTLEQADPGFVTGGRLLAGAFALTLTLPWTSAAQWETVAQTMPWLVAAGLGTAAGLLGLYRAMSRAGASIAAAFAGTAPVVTALGEFWVLGATLDALQLAGLLIVVSGAVLLALRS